MSQQNGQRARFQINRKRRVVRNMRMRALMNPAAAKPAIDAPPAATTTARRRAGPAVESKE